MNEHYFIHTETWFSVVGSIVGMLCVGCLENRLGRKLTPKDFPDVTINSPKHGNKSQRLLDRIKGKKYYVDHRGENQGLP